MEQQIREILEKAVQDSVFSAAVCAYTTFSGEPVYVPVGSYPEGGSLREVTDNTIFDVASVTKSVPVSSLALWLIDQGRLSLDTNVASIVPAFATNYRDEITIWHLLTQTLPFETSLASLKTLKPEALLAAVLQTRFPEAPGKALNYSNASSIILGLVLEQVSGQPLDRLADEVFFTPLGMSRTTFHPSIFSKNDIVPSEESLWKKRLLQGEIHDESASVLRSILIPGSAGLFSTAPDLLTFLRMLISGGTYEGKQYFSKEMLKAMSTNQLVQIGDEGCLGWELHKERYMGTHASRHTIGKTGFTGCVVIADMEQTRAMALLTNYHYPKRKTSMQDMNSIRSYVADIVFA